MMRGLRLVLLKVGVWSVLFLVGCGWVSSFWQGREAGRWYEGDYELQVQLAKGVEHWMNLELDRSDFSTGHDLFNGEWLFGTYMMAAMGFGQMAETYPEEREHYLNLMERAIDELLTERITAFDAERWGSDPLKMLESDEAHAAYLGYMNLAMSYHRNCLRLPSGSCLEPFWGWAECLSIRG